VNRFRYTAWDGSRRVKLDPNEVFEKLSQYLSETEDFGEAFDRMLREGFEGSEFEVVGLDDLLERIRAAIKDRCIEYNLDHALDDHRRRLDEIVESEEDALVDVDDAEERQRRDGFLSRLPRSVRDATARLGHYDFVDSNAESEFSKFTHDEEAVSRLSSFIDRHGALFQGRKSLGFEDALELLDEIEALKSLEQSLFSRSLDEVDADQLEALLGAESAEHFEKLREMISTLRDAGYIKSAQGAVALSPRGARKLGQLALREIYKSIDFGGIGSHDCDRRGPCEVDLLSSKPYAFGDPMHIDVAGTVRNALRRSPKLPMKLSPEDLEVHEAGYASRSATVLLLDMSWSMSWEGRFAAAKKVAMAMETLMRTRHPRDYFAIVGFYTRAEQVHPRDLPEVTWNMGDPFTNLQDGLRMGSDLLARQSGRNKTLIVITDGQPTAYFADGRLFCEWPMSLGGLSTRATVETLKEVHRVTRRGIRINTFMLDDSPPLTAFVEKMTAINRGRAFYSTPEQLGRFLLVDYVGKRRKVI
jgi:uncharacterized protein with von Willebrand factor type A (vWA) domain